MKRIYVLGCALLTLSVATAQQKEGTVVYERTSQTPARTFSINGMTQEIPAAARKDKFELSFGNNKSIWKQADPDNADETVTGDHGGGGFVFRSVIAGSNDVVFSDFAAAKRVEKREMFDKTFVIEDSVRPLKWKMTGETKTILNHPCMKATATNITSRTTMTMGDGKMERKEVADTATIVAWFASDVPVSAGPGEYQGQLPGLILEMDISNGRQVFKVLELSPKVDLGSIKEPSGKKRYTPDEFKKERDKMMEQMNQNNGGGNRRIIMN